MASSPASTSRTPAGSRRSLTSEQASGKTGESPLCIRALTTVSVRRVCEALRTSARWTGLFGVHNGFVPVCLAARSLSRLPERAHREVRILRAGIQLFRSGHLHSGDVVVRDFGSIRSRGRRSRRRLESSANTAPIFERSGEIESMVDDHDSDASSRSSSVVGTIFQLTARTPGSTPSFVTIFSSLASGRPATVTSAITSTRLVASMSSL